MNAYAVIATVAVAVTGIGVFLVWNASRAERKRGEAEAQRARFQIMSEQARKANAIDEDVVRLSDADLDRELRDGWR